MFCIYMFCISKSNMFCISVSAGDNDMNISKQNVHCSVNYMQFEGPSNMFYEVKIRSVRSPLVPKTKI